MHMKFKTRKLVTPADLNPRGTLHGGQLLKWIDEEGGIHACLELDTGLIVTKFISEIDFKYPVFRLGGLWMFISGPKRMRATATVQEVS